MMPHPTGARNICLSTEFQRHADAFWWRLQSVSGLCPHNVWPSTGYEYAYFSLSLSLSFCFCAVNRYGGLSPSGPGVAEFGILHQHEGDCSVRDAPEGIWNNTVGKYDKIGKTTSRVGAIIEIVFNKPVPYVGWYLKVMTRN